MANGTGKICKTDYGFGTEWDAIYYGRENIDRANSDQASSDNTCIECFGMRRVMHPNYKSQHDGWNTIGCPRCKGTGKEPEEKSEEFGFEMTRVQKESVVCDTFDRCGGKYDNNAGSIDWCPGCWAYKEVDNDGKFVAWREPIGGWITEKGRYIASSSGAATTKCAPPERTTMLLSGAAIISGIEKSDCAPAEDEPAEEGASLLGLPMRFVDSIDMKDKPPDMTRQAEMLNQTGLNIVFGGNQAEGTAFQKGLICGATGCNESEIEGFDKTCWTSESTQDALESLWRKVHARQEDDDEG